LGSSDLREFRSGLKQSGILKFIDL
jgi:hypothetical protein